MVHNMIGPFSDTNMAQIPWTTNVKSTFHVIESLSYLGPQIWNLVPKELKELSSVNVSKKVIKRWKPQNCPCRLYKNTFKTSILNGTFSGLLDSFLIFTF